MKIHVERGGSPSFRNKRNSWERERLWLNWRSGEGVIWGYDLKLWSRVLTEQNQGPHPLPVFGPFLTCTAGLPNFTKGLETFSFLSVWVQSFGKKLSHGTADKDLKFTTHQNSKKLLRLLAPFYFPL